MAGQRIIDCCSLLNLYAGWNGLAELASFGDVWHVGEAVLSEAQYIWDIAPDGTRTPIPINLKSLIDRLLILPVHAESDEELATYVELASELDDGEAQALAIAKHRGYVLLTDERKAQAIAQRREVDVQFITTAQVLQKWGGLLPANSARLPEVLKAIEERARFVPRWNTLDGEWWAALRQSSA